MQNVTMVGAPWQSSDWELPSLFSRPRCRRLDMPSRRAAAMVEVTEVATAAVTMAVDITVAAIMAVVIVAVMATFISADGIMAAAILLPAVSTAGRCISGRSRRSV